MINDQDIETLGERHAQTLALVRLAEAAERQADLLESISNRLEDLCDALQQGRDQDGTLWVRINAKPTILT